MTWPSAKGTAAVKRIFSLPPAQREAERNEKRRLAARGICVRCKVNPRASTMNICNPCHKKTAHKARAQKTIDRIRRFGCVICGGWVDDLYTRKGRPRFACRDCFKRLSHDYRLNGGPNPSKAILFACLNKEGYRA